MDHMMPEVDGIEASRRIRALADGTAENIRYKDMPIVALTANAVSGARELFLEAGMSDFISKPIEASALNTVLAKWLPAEKIITGEMTGAPQTENAAESDTEDALWTQLRAISGLDTTDGISHTGGTRDGYYRVLKQFCSGFNEGMRAIKESLAKEDWKDYAIRLHAYKGVLAMIGHKTLSAWALRLEMAGKSADTEGDAKAITLCKAETAPIIADMKVFYETLCATNLISKQNDAAKTKIDTETLTERLAALSAACVSFKAGDANKIAAELERISVDEESDAALTEILRLVASLDYDEAVEKINTLLIRRNG
jgi:HPt (histidine-containing phosphotransfer) domain-containing protein